MRKLIVLLAGLVICAMIVFPASAMPAHSGSVVGVVDQDANANIHGNDNTQNINNDVTVNQYSGETEQNAVSNVHGIGNTVTTTNNNQNINGDVTNGATSVSNNQQVYLSLQNAPAHSVLDTGAIRDHVVSLYSGEVYVVENDYELYDTLQLQKAGDQFKYSVKSSSPVLCYLIDAHDVDKVKSKSGAPEYDPVRQVFDHGWVNVAFPKVYDDQKYNHPSTNQWFTATMPDDGRYALVIDTRTTSNLNGIQTEITPNSIDIAYIIENVGSGVETEYTRTYTGDTVVYKTLESGKADNTEELVITH